MRRDDGGLLLGTDIGTQTAKTVLVNLEGRTLSSSAAEYGLLQPQPLWAEQWPDVWYEAACRTIKEAIAKANVDSDRIIGIGISGLYGGSGVPVDKNMKPIRPCIIWMDRRATDEVRWVKRSMDLDRLFKVTGNYVDTYYGFTKMLWIKNKEPETWKHIYKFIPPHSYVIYRLTGELAIDYSSAGNIGGIFDLRKRGWSEELLSEMGIPPSYLPQDLVESSTVVGHISKEAATITRLKEGIPVVAGGIDAAVATLSAGAFEEGDHVAMVGTSMCWGVVHEGEALSKKLVSMPYVAYPESKIYTFGGAATAGALPRWFRDEFGQVEQELSRRLSLDPFQILDLEAERVPPGSEGLIVLPYFMGERSPIWDPNARGAIIGLTLYHSRAHVFRAFLEGVAYALRHNMEVGQELGLKLKRNCILVGGASKSKLWQQIFADVTGYPQITMGGAEAPLGDALLAGIGVGAIGNYKKIKDWLKPDIPMEPVRANNELYESYFSQYKDIYVNLKENMGRIAQIGERLISDRKE